MDKYNFLQAKDTIFRLLAHYCHPIKKNGRYYMSHNYTSLLQQAFLTLGIKKPEIPLMDFCQMWENNNRAIWTYWNSGYHYYGASALMYYDSIVENYLARVDGAEEE